MKQIVDRVFVVIGGIVAAVGLGFLLHAVLVALFKCALNR